MINKILSFSGLDEVKKFLNNTHIEIMVDHVHIDIVWLGYHISEQWNKRIVFKAGIHKHSFFELHFCLKGSCVYQAGGKQYTILPGEMIILRAGETHCLLQKTLDFTKIALGFDIISLTDPLSKEMCQSLSQRAAFVTGETDTVAALFYRVLEETATQRMGFLTQTKLCLLEIIMSCARMTQKRENHQPTFSQRIDKRVEEVNSYIDAHMNQQITCQELADYIHLSIRQLSRVIQNEFGVSIRDYIDKLKCEYAKNLLLHSDMSMAKVANEVGFSSEFSFSRFFKRVEGMAPSQFRRSRYGGYADSILDDD